MENILPGHTYLRGTVSHIISDDTQQLVKVRVNQNNGKEFVLIDMPDISLNIGDKILLQKIDETNNYGIDNDFEEKFIFHDFTREGSVFLFLLFWLLLLGFAGRRSLKYTLMILLNVGLLLLILPLTVRGYLLWFVLIFCALNATSAYFLMPSAKTRAAIFSALCGTGISSAVYTLAIRFFHLTPLQYLAQNVGLDFFNFSPYTEVCVFIVMSFYLCIFSTIFFLKTFARNSPYQNFQLFVLQNSLLFLFLTSGLLLPYFLYFQLNNLTLLHFFNYPPFVYLFTRLSFCLLAVCLSGGAYLMYQYWQKKQEVVQPIASVDKSLDMQKILQEHQRKSQPKKNKISRKKKSK